MGKTFKDKALHFTHKPDEMPTPDVKDLVKIFSDYNYNAGLRYGNQRKMRSKLKVSGRKTERKKEQRAAKKEINEESSED